MADIDWDEVIGDAADSVRGLLSEVLELADEVDEMVVIVQRSDGKVRRWYRVRSQQNLIALLALTQFEVLHDVAEH